MHRSTMATLGKLALVALVTTLGFLSGGAAMGTSGR